MRRMTFRARLANMRSALVVTSAVPLVGLCIATLLAACKNDLTSVKDLTSAQVAQQASLDSLQRIRDSLLAEGGRVIYTVQVVDAGNSSFASFAVAPHRTGAGASIARAQTPAPGGGLSGVTVTTTQLGVVTSVTTDSTGVAVFPDMRLGKVAVALSAPNHTSASYTAELTPPPANPAASAQDITRNAATRVPLFPLTGSGTTTVSGVITYEADLTNGSPEAAPGVGISGAIVTDANFLKTYINTPGVDTTGNVLTITYSNAIASATTSATGAYSLTLPATANGLAVALAVSDVVANQSVLVPTLNGQNVFGPQSVRTIFSQAAGAVPSTIPAVRPAYITFDVPSGSGVNQAPVTAAAATAVISSGNVVSVNITSAGQGYTQTPNVVFSSTTGTGAHATATISGGRITAITVDAQGSGYAAATVALVSGATGATATGQITQSVTGVNVTNGGTKYSTAPVVTFTSSSGTGAAATANLLGYVDALSITNPGAGYTQVPAVQITAGGGSGATATAALSPGPVQQVIVPAAPDSEFTATPPVTIAGDGTGATATAALQPAGRVNSITVSGPGSGYTSEPTVTITGGGGGGALAVANLGAGNTIASITVVNKGAGYTSNPTVTITGGGGTGATATPTLAFPIASVTVTNGGFGYTNATATFNGNPIAGTLVTLSRSLQSLTLTSAGAGYTSNPTVTIVGNGAGATATAQMRFVVGSIAVTNMGSGYTTAPTVTITGDGINATATATLGNGVLSAVTITNPGSGYTAPPNIVLSGGGAPSQPAVVAATVSGGQVTGANIVSGGTGYTANPTFTVSTDIADATANPNIATGTVVAVNVTNPGLGYKGVPVVQFVSTSGSAAAGVAVLDASGRVQAINVTAGGSNYTVAPTVSIVVPNAATQAIGAVTVSQNGTVTGVTITDGGNGYSSAPGAIITPSVPGVGGGAVVQAQVTNGAVTGVVVVNGGAGYLGRNTPGNFFPTAATAIPGIGFSFSQPAGATLTLVSGVSVVNDIYMGTGTRRVP